MKVIFKVSLVALLLNTMNLTASKVVATVNGENITQKDVNAFVIASIPGATFAHLNEVQKKSVIKQMIERKLFLENAKEVHIEKNPEFIAALHKLRENLMLDYWMKEKVEEIVISEKDAKAYYKKHSSKFNRAASVKVRHILLAKRAEAVTIIRELEKSKELKKKFIDLAKEKSTGPSSVNGGELDWFIQEQMVPEFSAAAFLLKQGTITKEPVKTQFGYHVIYLEEKKKKGAVPFEKAKADIVKALRVEQFKSKLDKLSKKLKKTADISVK